MPRRQCMFTGSDMPAGEECCNFSLCRRSWMLAARALLSLES